VVDRGSTRTCAIRSPLPGQNAELVLRAAIRSVRGPGRITITVTATALILGRAQRGGDPAAARARARRLARAGRRVTACVLGPVVGAGTSLVPVAVTAGLAVGVTAVSAAVASAPAKAQTSEQILVVLVNGETTAPETALLQAAGYTVVTATASALSSMSKATFESYAAVVIGDSSSGGSCDTTAPTTASLGSQWQPWVTGNVAVLGTAPALAASLAGSGNTGASSLITGSVEYAAAGYSTAKSTGTGLYVSLNCAYSSSAKGTAVPFLNGVEGIPANGVTVQGGMSCSDSGTVNSWQAGQAGTFSGFTSSSLAAGSSGSWPSPGCPVQEAFDSWPAMFTPFAYDPSSNSDVTANFTASDGATGQPYILMGQAASSTTAALAPSAGGDVPAGTDSGGAGNPAAPGVDQALAAGSVNTENGDLTQSDTDVSVPTFGPSLDFTRSYDAQAAQQQTQAGTPGPMGYGWTDNWASSLSTGTPVPGDLYTLDGTQTDVNNGGPATKQPLNNPGAVTTYSGDTYIADTQGNRIEEIAGADETEWGITMTAGDMYTIVGSPTGQAGEAGDGDTIGPDGTALLNGPDGIAVNSTGMFISDTGNCRVLEIPSSGTDADDVEIYAGRNSNYCGGGDDSKPATNSDLDSPEGLHFGFSSEANDLYIADTGTNQVKEVAGANETEWGQDMTSGDIYTIVNTNGTAGYSSNGTAAGSAELDQPGGVTLNGGNDLYIADTDNCRVEEVPEATGSGWNLGTTTADDYYTVAGRGPGSCGGGANDKESIDSDLNYPAEVSFDSTYGLYIADTDSNVIKLAANNTSTQYNQAMTDGDIYGIAGNGNPGDSGDGGAAVSAEVGHPAGVSVASGTVTIADSGNDEIRTTGTASPYDITDLGGGAGSFYQDGDSQDDASGEPAYDAGLNGPAGVASDSHGDIFVADTYGNRVQEIAAWNHTQFGIAMTAGQVYTVAGRENGVPGGCSPGTSALPTASLCQPTAVAVDSSGNLYVADSLNNRVLKVAGSNGDVSLFAGNADGTAWASGDADNAVAATSAYLDIPYALATDAAGDVFVTNAANDIVQEIPASSGTSYGISMTAGDIYVIAGTAGTAGHSGDLGKATSADLNAPQGVAVDAAGNVYIGDYGNNRVQEVAAASGTQWGQVMTAGDIYTIAGSSAGTSGSAGDGGPATAALLSVPGQIATDAAGDLYITDAGNDRIQEIAAASGTQWGQQMTAGDIYTVAGETGQGGTWGALYNTPVSATSALLNAPLGIAVDPSGDMYITNSLSNYLDEVTATSTPAFPLYPAAATVTITQPGGAQISFYPQVSGACPSPEVAAGSYCVLPQDVNVTLTADSGVSYTFSPAPGVSDKYSWDGQLLSETDSAGNTLTVSDDYPEPGQATSTTGTTATSTAVTCPAAAASCQTIISASGRALVVGYSAADDSGVVTSVTDPLNRTWTYGYTGNDLTSVTDPMSNVTTYTYGTGTGNTSPLLANDLLTITNPDAQSGYNGPDADPGAATAITYNNTGQVTSQTDPMGYVTSFSYCANSSDGDCMNAATGNGLVTVTDPDGNTTVYDYAQGTLAAESQWTGSTLTSEEDFGADGSEDGTDTAGTLQDTWATDGNGNRTTYAYDSNGDTVAVTSPDGIGAQTATTTAWYNAQGNQACSATAEAASPCSSSQPGPAAVAPGSVISPPSSAPPAGVTYTLYDTDGNELYTTTGVYQPGSGSVSYQSTSYTLFSGDSVTLNGTSITCTSQPPSADLPCASISPDGTVTQLSYNSQGDLTQSSAPDGNGSQLATTSYAYDADGEQTSTVAPDGNVSGATAATTANYTTGTAYNADGGKTSVTQAAGSAATVTPRVTSYGYDGDGNQTSVTDARGYTITTTYNADDQATLSADPDGNQTLTCYDGDGNVTETVPPAGVAASSLTPASCPTAYPSGYGDRLASDATTTTYDAADDQTATTTPAPAGQSGSETTTYAYDGDGNVTRVTAPPSSAGGADQVTESAYNTANELASQTQGYGTAAASTTTYCYDPDGDQTSVVMPDGKQSPTEHTHLPRAELRRRECSDSH